MRTMKESCLERSIVFGEGSIRHPVSEFTVLYHDERNHQGPDNKLICPDTELVCEGGEVQNLEFAALCASPVPNNVISEPGRLRHDKLATNR